MDSYYSDHIGNNSLPCFIRPETGLTVAEHGEKADYSIFFFFSYAPIAAETLYRKLSCKSNLLFKPPNIKILDTLS